MSKALPDFLGGETVSEAAAAVEAPAVEIPAAEAASAVEEPVAEALTRGPDGKFLPKAEAAPAPQAEAAPAAVVPPTPEPNHAPLAALLDERDKRQAAERERDVATAKARDLEAWRTQQEAAARAQPLPDRDADPAGYEAHQRAQVDQALYAQRIEMSRGFAEMRHGPEVANAAFEWGVARCDQDPFFNQKVKASRDPVNFVVAEYQREQMLSKIGDPARFDAFLAWEAAQAAAPAPVAQAAPQAAPAAPPTAPAAPRPSLAAAPSAAAISAAIPRDGAATYDAMFGR